MLNILYDGGNGRSIMVVVMVDKPPLTFDFTIATGHDLPSNMGGFVSTLIISH